MFDMTGEKAYLEDAIKIYELYVNGGGMTYTYQNLNWWNRPKSWSLWRSLGAGTSAERKLVCSNKWDRAPSPEHSEEQQLDGLPWPLVPSSATIPSSNFTRCHLGKRRREGALDSRYPQRDHADLRQGCFIHKKGRGYQKCNDWQAEIFHSVDI